LSISVMITTLTDRFRLCLLLLSLCNHHLYSVHISCVMCC